MKKVIQIGKDFGLPLEMITITQAILAKKGSGKTHNAKVQAEELLKQRQQIIVIDPTGGWWGLKSGADGKTEGFSIAIFGGEHADLPLEESAGELIARAIVEQRFSAVLDLSLLRKGAMQRFMRAFLETLYRLNRDAMHLFIDEADQFAPQKPMGEEGFTLGAMQDVVRRGRIRGIGCTLITQRPAVLNKDVLTQADMLVCLRMGHPRDINAIEEWVAVHGDEKTAIAMIQSLPDLQQPFAWYWNPGWGIFEKVAVRPLETFDSSATPKPGERVRAPKILAPIDLAKLGEQMASTIARAKENDPATLKARIRELEKVAAKAVAAPAERIDQKKLIEAQRAEVEQILRNKVQPETIKMIEALAGMLQQTLAAMLQQTLAALDRAKKEASSPGAWTLGFLSDEAVKAVTGSIYTVDDFVAQKSTPPFNARQETSPTVRVKDLPGGHRLTVTSRNGSDGDKLTGTALRIAQVAASYADRGEGISRAMLAALLGVAEGGSFSARLSEAKSAGAISTEGGQVYATPEGMVRYREGFKVPSSTEEVMRTWSHKLGGIQRRMLDVLIQQRGKAITRAQLAEMVSAAEGGSFSARLSELRSTGLIVEPNRGMIAANAEALFL